MRVGRDRRIRTSASKLQRLLPCAAWLCLRVAAPILWRGRRHRRFFLFIVLWSALSFTRTVLRSTASTNSLAQSGAFTSAAPHPARMVHCSALGLVAGFQPAAVICTSSGSGSPWDLSPVGSRWSCNRPSGPCGSCPALRGIQDRQVSCSDLSKPDICPGSHCTGCPGCCGWYQSYSSSF